MSSAAHLLALAERDVEQSIAADELLPVLASAPFVHIPGTFNARDLGLVPSNVDPTSPSPSGIRPGFIFRSGSFTLSLPGVKGGGKGGGGGGGEGNATAEEQQRQQEQQQQTATILAKSVAALSGQLGVRRIFDLRSVEEHDTTPDPDLAGIEVVWVRPREQDAKVNPANFVAGLGEAGFRQMYLGVLTQYASAFRAVLEHVRDRPAEPVLFHCTAGRDRTGVLSGLLHALAGAPQDVIVLDFMLSRVGTEPARERLLAFAKANTGLGGAAGASGLASLPGVKNLASLREPCWSVFLDGLQEEHGGWEGYATSVLGFTPADLERIGRNLRVAPTGEREEAAR